MNDSIYIYFKASYGTVDNYTDKELVIKYKEYFTNSLKKALKRLKMPTAPTSEIRCVSRLLRTKFSNKPSINSPSSVIHYDKQISKYFWGFVKNIIAKPSKVLPSLSHVVCIKHFIRMFSSVMPTRQFTFSSWIPSLEKPSTPFNFEESSERYSQNENFRKSVPARSDISDLL